MDASITMDGVRLLTLALLFALNLPAAGSTVRDLKIKVLSTMLADGDGIGEWGFAAMVEVDGRRILFDTGWRPQTVASNAADALKASSRPLIATKRAVGNIGIDRDLDCGDAEIRSQQYGHEKKYSIRSRCRHKSIKASNRLARHVLLCPASPGPSGNMAPRE